MGNRTNQVDALLRETRYEYDALGRRTKRTQPAGQVGTYAYNVLGSLSNKVDFTGKTTKFFYDLINRLVWRGFSRCRLRKRRARNSPCCRMRISFSLWRLRIPIQP